MPPGRAPGRSSSGRRRAESHDRRFVELWGEAGSRAAAAGAPRARTTPRLGIAPTRASPDWVDKQVHRVSIGSPATGKPYPATPPGSSKPRIPANSTGRPPGSRFRRRLSSALAAAVPLLRSLLQMESPPMRSLPSHVAAVLASAALAAGLLSTACNRDESLTDPSTMGRPHPSLAAITGVTPAVSAGWFHTCALKDDGTVVCWGANTYANGDPSFVGQATPPTGMTFTQVSAGGYHTCGIKSGDGTIACWGNSAEGEAPASQLPPAGTTFTQVSAGASHTCALVSNGTVACWGYDGYGQATPPAGTTFTKVSAGGYHTCGIKSSDGTIVCWGRDDLGQLAAPAGVAFTQLSAGVYHTCGVSTDGTIAGWGLNNLGQAAPPAGSSFTQVGAGGFHSCGRKNDGTLACWGTVWSYDLTGQGTPPAGTTFIQVSGGYSHTCALKTDGTVVCAGDNTNGAAAPPA